MFAAIVAIVVLIVPVSGVGVPLTCASEPFKSLPFCDESLPTSARVADALSRMPLSEKLNAMYRPFGSPFVDCGGNGGVPSLGIAFMPQTAECLHGVGVGCIQINGTRRCPTLFPNAVMMAASFNRSLFGAVGATIGDEMRAVANIQNSPSGTSCWAPNGNVCHKQQRAYLHHPDPLAVLAALRGST